MFKNIVLTIYVIIIGIAIGVAILSNHMTEAGIIEFGNTALVEIESDVLKPETVTGDLAIIDTSDTKVKKDDIISYVTLEQGNAVIRTNRIEAIVQDENDENIYSLKKEDGTIENIDDSCILGTHKMTIPYAGVVLGYIMTQQGFYSVTLFPAVILFLISIISFAFSLLKKKDKPRYHY